MKYGVLIEETRNGLVENIHHGIICGVNDQLESVYFIGDENQPVYYRSASKPIQAIPLFSTDIIEKYHINQEEAALFTASHRGEKYHIQALESLKKKLSIEESDLFCPATYPLNIEPREDMVRQRKEKSQLYHNCAGKHIGYVAVCRELGFPIAGYWEINHPLQQMILNILSNLSEIPESEIMVGTDGCGVPVFALPMKNMAISYLKLACPDLIDHQETQHAVRKLTKAMNAHPRMVASEDFICSILLKDPNIIAKGGAQGVYCIGLKKERMGFALKVYSGVESVWPNIVASILDQINYSNKETIRALRTLSASVIKNDKGMDVGELKETFVLKKS